MSGICECFYCGGEDKWKNGNMRKYTKKSMIKQIYHDRAWLSYYFPLTTDNAIDVAELLYVVGHEKAKNYYICWGCSMNATIKRNGLNKEEIGFDLEFKTKTTDI
jgi:hypothetical protein